MPQSSFQFPSFPINKTQYYFQKYFLGYYGYFTTNNQNRLSIKAFEWIVGMKIVKFPSEKFSSKNGILFYNKVKKSILKFEVNIL